MSSVKFHCRHNQTDPPGGNPQPWPHSSKCHRQFKEKRGNLRGFFKIKTFYPMFFHSFLNLRRGLNHRNLFFNTENRILIFVSFFRRCKDSEIWVCNFSANRENICKCCSWGLCFKIYDLRAESITSGGILVFGLAGSLSSDSDQKNVIYVTAQMLELSACSLQTSSAAGC